MKAGESNGLRKAVTTVLHIYGVGGCVIGIGGW